MDPWKIFLNCRNGKINELWRITRSNISELNLTTNITIHLKNFSFFAGIMENWKFGKN